MPVMPTQILRMGARGLLSLLPLGAGIYALWQASKPRRQYNGPGNTRPTPEPAEGGCHPGAQRFQDAPIGWERDCGRHLTTQIQRNQRIALLLGGAALLGWSFGGGRAAHRLLRRKAARSVKSPDFTVRWLRLPDGTKLHVKLAGPSSGAPIVFVHGLGADGDEWYEIRGQLAERYRVIDWDLPGLGKSTMPPDRPWSLDALARDLDAVLSVTEGRPAVLIGHSLGGMILLTFCRLFPEALGPRVRGLVLAHTTYTNPVKTTAWSRLHTALQKPVLEPLCHLTIWLAPLVRPLCILSYLNGSAHRGLQHSLFTGRESWALLDFLARYYLRDAPDIVARGLLAMFRYDETKTLETIHIPTLVVSGDEDVECAAKCQAFLCNTIPGAEQLILRPAKHGGLLEYPGQFVEALEKFMSRWEQETGSAPESVDRFSTDTSGGLTKGFPADRERIAP